MGRHHIKLPDHLYLSPPSPRLHPSSFASAASLLSLKSTAYTSPAALIQETSSTARAVGNKIPGFQASAAFLTNLRANINLDNDGYPDSLTATPDSLRPTHLASSTSSLPLKERLSEISLDSSNMAKSTSAAVDPDFAPPSALDLPKPVLSEDAPDADAADSSDPSDIPPLTSYPVEDDTTRIEALRLVADSVAQQRQRASRIVIVHPITFAVLAAALGGLYQYFYKGTWADLATVGTSFAGVIMSMFALVRMLGGGYIEEAERVGTWRWLDEGRTQAAEDATGKKPLSHTDEILVTKFGGEYIATIVFRGVNQVDTTTTTSASANGSSKKVNNKKSNSSTNETRTEIRAWTVKTKYRNKGVGTALLEDAIKVAHDKGWTSGGVVMADNHANSKRVLPSIFNGAFDKDDKKTREFLQKKVAEFEKSSFVSTSSPSATGVDKSNSKKGTTGGGGGRRRK